MSDVIEVTSVRTLRGVVRVPGDKSASHRALMLSALADGTSTVTGLSSGLDVRSTASILTALGARVDETSDLVAVTGPVAGLAPSPMDLDCGNSGTTMRLMAGILGGVAGRHTLTGDSSLLTRPMDRVATPLALMGAVVQGHGPRAHGPLVVTGSSALRGIDYHVPVSSAQVKSAVLLAGLSASGHTNVAEDVRTRSTTEDMLRHAGVTIHSVDQGPGRTVTLTPGRPAVLDWVVPGDPSQAAFFAVLGLIHPDAELAVSGLDGSPERVGFVAVLERMGATVSLVGERTATTLRSSSSDLVATEVFAREIPSVDEVPILCVAAAAATGVSSFRMMGELRIKESDRFAASMALAHALGCAVWSEGDDFFIEGVGSATAFQRFELAAGLDHRMVMAAAVAATSGAGGVIYGTSTVSTSYPGFFDDLASLQ